MERKIGEILEYNGEWYQCVEGYHCYDCDFRHENGTCIIDANYPESKMGNCNGDYRPDNQNVVFKKLEKVGEPYNIGTHIYQRYKVFMKSYIFNDSYFAVNSAIDDEFINIEIKQTKEYMGEKKLNLKPFDIQKAREGKPVCTRDGRKARIICFDIKSYKGKEIIALVTKPDGYEYVEYYTQKGKFSDSKEDRDDLMMLPEKKEMWINIYKGNFTGGSLYDTEEEAKIAADMDDNSYITTAKVSWEE